MSRVLFFVVTMSGNFILEVGKSYNICFNQPDKVVVGGKQTPWRNVLRYFYMKLFKTVFSMCSLFHQV